MYEKNLTEDLRLRLSLQDMEFLRTLSEERATSISECIRSIIGEYRRSLDTIKLLSQAIDIAKKQEVEGKLSHGDTKSDLDNFV